MYHKVKLMLILVLISLAAAHAKCVEDIPSPGHRAKGETIKFGAKTKPMQHLGTHYCFFEYKLINAAGLQIGINPLNLDWNKLTFSPYRSLSWGKEDYSIRYTEESILDAFSLRIYPDRYKQLCIYVSYIKDKSKAIDGVGGSYHSIFGLDYEFDKGIMLIFSANKGIEHVQKMLRGQIKDLTFQLSIGLNLVKMFG